MKTWRLVSGIFSCIFPVLILFQSCAAGVAGAIKESEDLSAGSGAGMIVSFLMLAGGIVSIVSRKGGSDVAIMIVYGIGALLGLTLSTTGFKDLLVWGSWCLICAVLAFKARWDRKKILKETEGCDVK